MYAAAGVIVEEAVKHIVIIEYELHWAGLFVRVHINWNVWIANYIIPVSETFYVNQYGRDKKQEAYYDQSQYEFPGPFYPFAVRDTRHSEHGHKYA